MTSSARTISKEIQTWMDSKSEQMRSHPSTGYFPADTVVDAFEKGKKSEFEKWEAEVKRKIQCMDESVFQCLENLKSLNYSAQELYLSFNPMEAKALILIDEESHLSDHFIDTVYPAISKIESKFRKEYDMELDISFLDDAENINRKQLKADGFFGINLLTGQKIFE